MPTGLLMNLHHLHYFWVVAREGGVSAAARRLGVATATISAQIAQLEGALGVALFERRGRQMALTDAGQTALQQADEIFSIAQALPELVTRPLGDQPRRLAVGIADALPKLLARQVIERAFRAGFPVTLHCREDHADRLVADLSVHALDIVLSDAPVPLARELRAVHHVLLESPVVWLAAPALADRLREGFPRSLDGQAVLLPTTDTSLRREVDRWFEGLGVVPRVVAEIADSALARSFAEGELGALPVPAPEAADAARSGGLVLIGEAVGARARCYAITLERRLKNPLVRAMVGPALVRASSSSPIDLLENSEQQIGRRR